LRHTWRTGRVIAASAGTRDVLNQPPPDAGRSLFSDRIPLVEIVEREPAG